MGNIVTFAVFLMGLATYSQPPLDFHEEDFLDRALHATAQISWSQDYLMSDLWIGCTRSEPCVVGEWTVWETNPFVAGKPEKGPLFAGLFVNSFREFNKRYPRWVTVPASVVVLASHWQVITKNQVFREEVGAGRLWGVGWSWQF